MNANALFINHDYAYYYDRGNTEYVPNAERIRVLRIIKDSTEGAKRGSTNVLVKFLNDDGTQMTERTLSYGIVAVPDKEVRARDILDHWDHYELERETRKSNSAIDWSEYANLQPPQEG